MESLSQFGANNTANQHIVTDSNFQVANSMFFLFHLIFTLWGENLTSSEFADLISPKYS